MVNLVDMEEEHIKDSTIDWYQWLKPKTKLQPLSKLPILESWNNCFSDNNWEIGKVLPLKQLKEYFPRLKVCTLDN